MGLFIKRNFNIESILVGYIEFEDVLCMMFVVNVEYDNVVE